MRQQTFSLLQNCKWNWGLNAIPQLGRQSLVQTTNNNQEEVFGWQKSVWCSTACSSSQTLNTGQGVTTELSSEEPSNLQDLESKIKNWTSHYPFHHLPLEGPGASWQEENQPTTRWQTRMTAREEGDQISGLPKSHASHAEAVSATIGKWQGFVPQIEIKLSWASTSLKRRNLNFGDDWAAEAFSIWISNTSTQGWFTSLRSAASHFREPLTEKGKVLTLSWQTCLTGRIYVLLFCRLIFHSSTAFPPLSLPSFCSIYSVLSVPLSYKYKCVCA